MDHSVESGSHATAGGPVLEQELSTSSPRCLTESGGNVLLQLLEFKNHLLEAVEELHIRRDAEARFEDQINKLVLEKQELEWEKESLQHQTETLAKQHTESLTNVKKQFQAKIRNIEEEKGKYQVSAELKDKEINNLKEELKSLQLLKYNLSKKSNELEQKLALQSRSKDSHLNQLGEVEKRFSALSRQCAIVKQAHEKLEQDVDEAMKINEKLTSENRKQDTTVLSLKKELEEVSRNLIKAKMSSVRHDVKANGATGREQSIQQLQHKLNMETEMSRKLEEENVTLRAEKQEVMRSLQHTQQLLLSQTQTVSRVELEMQTQRELYQSLKQEHEVMREKSKALEDKVARLMESYAASETSWDKERAMFLDRIKSEQADLQAVTEAYDELQQKHTELSSQPKVQTQHIYELEMTGSSQRVSTQVFPSLAEEIREEETLNEPIFSLEHSVQTKTPDCLDNTGAVTVLVDYEAAGGQDTPNHHLSQFKQPLNMSTCSLTNNNLLSISSLSEATFSVHSTLNKYTRNSDTGESDHDVVSDLVHSTSSDVTDTSAVSSTANDGSGDLLRKGSRDGGNGGTNGENSVTQGKNNKEEERSGEEVRGDDVKEGGSAGEKRGALMAHTADRGDRREDSQRSAEDTGDTKQPETETKDRAKGEGTDGAEERAKKGLHSPETQIIVQTTTDMTTEESNAQAIDSMDTEPRLAACEPSDCLSRTVSERDADSSYVNKGCEIKSEVHTLCSDEHQHVSPGPNSVIQEMQCLSHEEAQTFAESLTQMPLQVHQGFKETTEEKQSNRLAVTVLTDVSKLLNQSSICSSQINAAPFTAPLDGIVCTQDREKNTTQTQCSYPPDTASNMEQTDETCDLTRVSKEPVLVKSHSLQISAQERGQLRSLVADVQDTVGKTNVMGACADITVDNVDFVSAVETDSCQEPIKSEDAREATTTKSETDFKLPIHQSYEDDASPDTGSTKCCEQLPTREMLLDDTNESSLPSTLTYRSSFDWASVQRKTVGSSTTSDVSGLHQFVQGSHMSEQNTSDPVGVPGYSTSTIPMFLKNKHRKVPLLITKASDLLNASCVSGTADFSRSRHQGEWKAVRETCRETTAAADTESRASLSISSYPVSTSSIAVSRLSWQTTPGCSRARSSAAGLSSESGDWEPSCSQESEDQQSSLRAQISKIEQFLNTERLRLPKRRKTDN